MAKAGIDGSVVGALLTDASRKAGWSLCVGAGVSRPIFPDWGGLVDSLLLRAGNPHICRATPPLGALPADALIEASRSVLRIAPAQFSGVLTEELYAPVRARLTDGEWRTFCRVLNAKAPADCSSSVWQEFAKIRRKHLRQTSGAAIAQVLAPLVGKTRGPREVLSFNAEPLLYALLTHDVRRRARGNAIQRLDLVTRTISHRQVGRLPYVYCHGLLPVPTDTSSVSRTSLDKLVFSEGQYLGLSSRAHSFQAAAFIDAAAHRRILFVGVSLSDSNMRRWLSWVHSVRVDEIGRTQTRRAAPSAAPADSTPHLWINQRPAEPPVAQWIEASVAHLGVRLVWIDTWSQVGHVLRRLLA